MRATGIILTLLLAGVAFAGAAAAQGGPGKGGPGKGQGKGKGACKADVARLCGDVERGEGRVRQCLESKKDQLSEGCRTHVEAREAGRQARQAGREARREARKASRDAVHVACAAEMAKHCGGIEPGDGRLRACINGHMDTLSADCKAALAGHQPMRMRHGKGHGKDKGKRHGKGHGKRNGPPADDAASK